MPGPFVELRRSRAVGARIRHRKLGSMSDSTASGVVFFALAFAPGRQCNARSVTADRTCKNPDMAQARGTLNQ